MTIPRNLEISGIVAEWTVFYGEDRAVVDNERMAPVTRITLDPEVMGGKPCIRGLRITVGTVVGLVASGRTIAEILTAYPHLEEADIREALSYAAWRVEETEVPIGK